MTLLTILVQCSVLLRVIIVFRDIIYVTNIYLCNKYTLFVTFSYLWTLFVRICGTIDPRHTYDEYLVLLAKSIITISEGAAVI
jgi:hypothetical protein